ncbi:MAG: DMT family transporter [Ignavibacteria bacterium]|nr:DMT family transporter [Ignavibacteria bacterium]
MIGELSALLTAFLWSITSLLFANAVSRIGSVQLNVSRQIIALIFLSTVIFLFGFDLSLTARQILFLGLSGFVGLTFGDTFLFLAYREIGARISMLIMSLSPAVAAVLAFFLLKEKLSFLTIIGMTVTLSGILLVVYDKNGKQENGINYLGLFFAFLASVGQGIGLVLAKNAFLESNNSLNGFVATFIRLFASISILLPVSLIMKKFKNPIIVFQKDPKAFLLTVGGSIAGPFLGITFSLIAVSHTKVGIASTIMALPPVIMLPLVKYFYNEKLNFRAVVGAFIAVFGVAILFLRN